MNFTEDNKNETTEKVTIDKQIENNTRSIINNKKTPNLLFSLIPKMLSKKRKESKNKTTSLSEDNVHVHKTGFKPISFVKGETINPYRTTKTVDPNDPPIIKLTKLSMCSADKTYALSRFRERKIYENVRDFLAFFHKNKDVCLKGVTKTSLTVFIDQEGLPTDLKELEELYFTYNIKIGLSRDDIMEDLKMHESGLINEHRDHLTKVRENWKKYMT